MKAGANLSSLGASRLYDWGGPNGKSHAMTSSEIFEEGIFKKKGTAEWKNRSLGLPIDT